MFYMFCLFHLFDYCQQCSIQDSIFQISVAKNVQFQICLLDFKIYVRLYIKFLVFGHLIREDCSMK